MSGAARDGSLLGMPVGDVWMQVVWRHRNSRTLYGVRLSPDEEGLASARFFQADELADLDEALGIATALIRRLQHRCGEPSIAGHAGEPDRDCIA